MYWQVLVGIGSIGSIGSIGMYWYVLVYIGIFKIILINIKISIQN
jgi:hypothetical protein